MSGFDPSYWVPRGAICISLLKFSVDPASLPLRWLSPTSLTPVGRSSSSSVHPGLSLAPLCGPHPFLCMGGPWIISIPTQKTVSKQKLKNEGAGGMGQKLISFPKSLFSGLQRNDHKNIQKIKMSENNDLKVERSVLKTWGRKLWKMAFFEHLCFCITWEYPEEKKASWKYETRQVFYSF